jgi:hypothetical protein
VDDLEEQFHEAMLEVYRRAKSEAGYSANIFLRMVVERAVYKQQSTSSTCLRSQMDIQLFTSGTGLTSQWKLWCWIQNGKTCLLIRSVKLQLIVYANTGTRESLSHAHHDH